MTSCPRPGETSGIGAEAPPTVRPKLKLEPTVNRSARRVGAAAWIPQAQRNRRRLGVPVQPRRFFSMLWENVIRTGLGLVLIAEAAGRPVGAAVLLAWNGTMIGKFIASDEDAWSLRPNYLLVWHAAQAASELGCRWFDFGRTDAANTGLRAYKQSWGAVEEPLVYGTLGASPEPASHGNGMASRLLASAIRHGPLLVCRAAGETLYRYAA